MNKKYILYILILMFIQTNNSHGFEDFDPNTFCQLVPNNTRIKDPRACNTAIDCIDGKPNDGLVCEEGYFYDRNNFDCVPKDEIKCISSTPCLTLNDFEANPYDCYLYYYCKGSVVSGTCTNGFTFDPVELLCKNMECKLLMDPNSYCNIVPDGVFIQNKNDCSSYKVCWDGEVLTGYCPEGYYYDVLNDVCDFMQNVECPNETKPNPNELCSSGGTFVADPDSCNGYYYCFENENGGIDYTFGRCPTGRFFSLEKNGTCIARTETVCQQDRCVTLGYTKIQMANRYNDNCQGFSICQDGKTIGSNTCPESFYFDEVIQKCTEEPIEYPACTILNSE